MDKWTSGISGRLKNAALDGVFKNANSFLVVGSHINKVNLSFLKSFKHVF